MKDTMNDELQEYVTKILTWIEGNTSIRYEVESVEFNNEDQKEFQFVVRTKPVRVNQTNQAIAMIATRMHLTISGSGERSDLPDVWWVTSGSGGTKERVNLSCAFVFETPAGGVQSVTRTFTFRQGDLFYVW